MYYRINQFKIMSTVTIWYRVPRLMRPDFIALFAPPATSDGLTSKHLMGWLPIVSHRHLQYVHIIAIIDLLHHLVIGSQLFQFLVLNLLNWTLSSQSHQNQTRIRNSKSRIERFDFDQNNNKFSHRRRFQCPVASSFIRSDQTQVQTQNFIA